MTAQPLDTIIREQTEQASRLKWHVVDNLRWLADQSTRPDYMPCGVLTGVFLLDVADRYEEFTREAIEALAQGQQS